ncbi:hypothetical protein EU527_05910 [Candidatus Thorarchaeota archaeon]|nr:MAG: hypothetical protein EU527_05910 [Candidatus Thorarchaeota archaeon]
MEDVRLSALQALNIDLSSKDMVVLGALLKSQNEPTKFVDFETIRGQLEVDEGGRKGKDSLIYRSLSLLESSGYIQVDRSSHKHGYNSSVRLLHTAIRKLKQERRNTYEKELNDLDNEIQNISDIDVESLQSKFVGLMVGEHALERPVFVTDWENILHLLDEKIYRDLTKGDIVRLTTEWLYRFDELDSFRVKKSESLLNKGVVFRGLERKKSDSSALAKRISLMKIWKTKGYDIGYRIKLKEDATYQFISRNSEGIVLILSESPFSATWLPRESNPELVDNAIENFDVDYNSGLDVFEIGE